MESSQKAVKVHFSEKKLFYEGILDPQTFARNYILRCYEPSEAMAPFVEHYFISRRRPQFNPEYIGHDVLSQPVVSLFIQPGGAFFQGPTIHKRTLRAKDSPIYAGAQFKPGGFYPFWQHRVSDLAEKTIPAVSIIPKIQEISATTLLHQDDVDILIAIDEALCDIHPYYEPRIGLINEIVAYIESGQATSVATIANAHSLSERSLQQLFQVYVGVGIKWVIMRTRFLEVIKFARVQTKPDWTAIATDFGYSDQSHFIKDFKKIVGFSPRQYTTLIRSHK
jgi:AraC-like DNA-binding protein